MAVVRKLINLAPATYNVQIRDAAQPGCVIILNGALVITEPAVLNATVTPTMVTCFGANDGIISITAPSGGYGTYQYTLTEDQDGSRPAPLPILHPQLMM